MTTTTAPPSDPTPDVHADDGAADRSHLGSISIALGVAGLLPVLPLVGSLAAIVCGWLARSSSSEERTRGTVGIVLGVVGVMAPLAALFVYCVVLGYPFPIHRYQPD